MKTFFLRDKKCLFGWNKWYAQLKIDGLSFPACGHDENTKKLARNLAFVLIGRRFKKNRIEARQKLAANSMNFRD